MNDVSISDTTTHTVTELTTPSQAARTTAAQTQKKLEKHVQTREHRLPVEKRDSGESAERATAGEEM